MLDRSSTTIPKTCEWYQSLRPYRVESWSFSAISEAIGRHWNSFAAMGKPEGWPEFAPESFQAMVYKADGTTEVQSFKNFKSDKIAFWSKVIEAKASSLLEKQSLGVTSGKI